MANRNDRVRAFAASASSVLLEHDYSGCFRNNNRSNKNGSDNKENVFEPNNKFRGTFDAVDKWADSVIMRVPIGHDRRKIVDREITIHKVKYPFLPEQQIRGKVYRKFGIPTVMGGVLSRVVASFSGFSAKDRPKRRRNPRKANDGRGAAVASQDSRPVGDAGSGPEAEEPCLGGSKNHPRRLLTCEQLTSAKEAPVRQEMSPPTVSSSASEVSNNGSLLGSVQSWSPSREQESPRGLELSKKSPDTDSSETPQLISSLDLDRLSLDDEIEPTLFRKSEISAQRRTHKSIYSQLTQISDRKAQRVWTWKEATVVPERVSTNRVASAGSLESFETAANASLDDVPTQIYASASGTDAVCANTNKNYPRISSFGRRDNFLPTFLDKNSLDANEFLLLERVRWAGETFVRKFDRASSSWEEQSKDQSKMKKSSSTRLVDPSDLGVKKGQPEEFVSRCSSSHKQPEVPHFQGSTAHEQPEDAFRCSGSHRQPEVLHSRGSTFYEQPEVLDSRSSATSVKPEVRHSRGSMAHEQPEVLGSRSSSRGVGNSDHSYSGRRAPAGTGSEKPRERKRRRIVAAVNFPRKIRKFGSLKSAGSKIRLTGKLRSSEDKENLTYVPYCVEVENETNIVGEYSLHDDIILPTVVASPLSTVKTKQSQTARPIATKASKFTGEPEVDADSPKNLNGSSTDSSPASWVPWWTDTHLLSIDLLSNHCSEYDQDLAIEAKPDGHANESPSCEKNRLKENLRVSSSEIARKVEKILKFLDEDCVDF